MPVQVTCYGSQRGLGGMTIGEESMGWGAQIYTSEPEHRRRCWGGGRNTWP
jgi:hypothetical protein